MKNRNTDLHISERLIRYATDIAGWQLDTVEREMQLQPDRYTEYAAAREHTATAESDLIQKLGDEAALEEYTTALNARAAALAVEMYLRGVLDGGSVCYAFATHKFPQGGVRHE